MRGQGVQRAGGSRYNREWNSTSQHNRQSGPLLTDHLKDIDIELEILNRKRQMIQQEHELLDREREYNLKRHYEFEQSSHNQQHGKRQAVGQTFPRWFNTPPKVEPWQQSTVSVRPRNPVSASNPPSLLSIASKYPPKLLPPDPKQIRTTNSMRNDFQPTKVAKLKFRTAYLQKPAAQVKKQLSHVQNPSLNNILPSQPKNLPPNKIQSKKDTAIGQDFILRHNVTPSPQLNGRLELALGSILRSMREQFQDNPSLSVSTASLQSQRIIKQIIRERIRSVMMNKLVGQCADVVASYRQKYPDDSDSELLKLAHDAHVYNIHSLSVNPLFTSDDAMNYFKDNVTQILSKKADEILCKVKDISTSDKVDANIKQLMDKVIYISDDEDTNETSTEGNKKENENEKANNVTERSEEDKMKSQIAKAKTLSDLMDNLIEKKLPKILPKFKDVIVSTFDFENQYLFSKPEIIQETMNAIVKRLVNEERESRKVIVSETTETALVKNTGELPPIVKEPLNTLYRLRDSQPVKETTSETPLLKTIESTYYVKLIGRPTLPSRNEVYEYLKQFKPTSIKKHKTMGNLLVIAFNEKEGYDQILRAGDHKIGENTMTVKGSEKVTTQNISLNNSVQEITNTSLEIAGDKSEDTCEKDNIISKKQDNHIDKLKTTLIEDDQGNTTSTEHFSVSEQGTHDSAIVVEDGNNVTAATDTTKGDLTGEAETMSKHDNSAVVEERNVTGVNDTTNDDITGEDDKTISEENENATKTNDTPHQDQNLETNLNAAENLTESETVNEDISAENSLSKAETTMQGKNDTIENLKESDSKTTAKSTTATPTRSSSRLAAITPSSIKTRRASRMAQNN
ncbi:unnamed protein product [Leptosia nina]|uniref:RRM domain-containing protein n=1 Tax=Leptosia nina TaxID=320188 RepID=A0AAV1JKJ4_9NEOP